MKLKYVLAEFVFYLVIIISRVVPGWPVFDWFIVLGYVTLAISILCGGSPHISPDTSQCIRMLDLLCGGKMGL